MAACRAVALTSAQIFVSISRAQCARQADSLHMAPRAPLLSRATSPAQVRQCAQAARAERRCVRAQAAGEGKDGAGDGKDEKVPGWAQPGSGEMPPWARSEAQREKPFEVPFWAYLLASTFVAIAAVGSIFEYTAGNPVFGVISNDSPLWAPILLFFAVSGFPTSGFLLYKAIQAANKAAREADEEDRL